jgi:hypothetical protein
MTKAVSKLASFESKSSSTRSTTESALAAKTKRQDTKIVEMTRILANTNQYYFKNQYY